MNNQQKARSLYRHSAKFEKQGNVLLARKLEKLADYYGSLFVKESLGKTKSSLVDLVAKTAVIEKPKSESYPHKKYSQKEASMADYARQAWAWGAKNPLASNMGRGAAMATGAGLVAVPAASAYLNKATENTFDTLGDKLKQYAVPGALAVAGLAAGAYGLQNSGNRRHTPILPRSKFAEIISGVKTREKLSSAFGSSSTEVRSCEVVLSRILFKD